MLIYELILPIKIKKKDTRLLGCKAVVNPVEQNKKLEESDESSPVDKGRY